jgi:hypothetical protein
MKTREELIYLALRAVNEAKKYKHLVDLQDEKIELLEQIVTKQQDVILQFRKGELVSHVVEDDIRHLVKYLEVKNRLLAIEKNKEKGEKNYNKFVSIVNRYKIDLAEVTKGELPRIFSSKHGLKLSEATLYKYKKRFLKE